MFKILDDKCTPVRSTKYSAYVDLFAREDVVIGAGETKIVKLGVALDLEKLKPKHYFKSYREYNPDLIDSMIEIDDKRYDDFMKSHYLEVALRSSLGVKGLIISNGIGIIDLDYPDEIGLIVHNPISSHTKHDSKDRIVKLCGQSNHHPFGYFKISKGDKVAQCTLKEHKGWLMGYESDVVRVSGFGSTGI